MGGSSEQVFLLMRKLGRTAPVEVRLAAVAREIAERLEVEAEASSPGMSSTFPPDDVGADDTEGWVRFTQALDLHNEAERWSELAYYLEGNTVGALRPGLVDLPLDL